MDMNWVKFAVGVLSPVGVIILGWLWVDNYFYPRHEAEADMARIEKAVTKVYYEVKIDQHHIAMEFMEKRGTVEENQREYDLLKFGLERMTEKLMELDK